MARAVSYGLLLSLLLPLSAAHAVFVLRKGETEPIVGHLISENARQLVVRVETGDSDRNSVVPRDEIEELIYTVDRERLAALSPAQPAAYREYAEELAEMKADPEARDTARRLFVIAAQLDRTTQGRSALLGLATLARTPQEEAAARGAAYMADAVHDRGLLRPWQTVKLAATPTAEASDELLKSLVLARHGDFVAAKRVAESPKGKAQYAQIESIFPRREFLGACTSGRLTDDQLRRLLSAELALLRGDAVSTKAESTPADWSRAARTKSGLAAVPSTSFEYLTEFDPQASVYRDGKWQRP
jgi:hypothetical protein